jgi:hypothetical protein
MNDDNVIYADFTHDPEEGHYFVVDREDGVLHYLGDFGGGEEGFADAAKVAAIRGIEPVMIINEGIANQWGECIVERYTLGLA